MNTQYFELLKNKIETGLQSTSQTDASNDSKPQNSDKVTLASKKLTLKDVQEKVRQFLVNAKIFEKSMSLFNGKSKFKNSFFILN